MSASFSTLLPDIIQNHILTRLDGPALASLACVSSELHALSTEEKLWQEICLATWNSVNTPRVGHVISTFPSGHRSFFSDSFPLLNHSQPSSGNPGRSPPTSPLILAVDIYYKNELIFSRVRETKTATEKFLRSPYRVDLLDPKEAVLTPVQHEGEIDTWLKHLEENVSLSWIVIDPTKKRAANLSTRRPVRVRWPCEQGEAQLHYATIMAGDGRSGSNEELVKCGLVVSCSGVGEGEVHVEEVSMEMEDMEGRILNGRDSLVILTDAIENGRRCKKGKGNEGKKRYQEFEVRKRERKQRREKVKDMVRNIGPMVLVMVLAFWCFLFMGSYKVASTYITRKQLQLH
ncbi:F-box protein At2g27310-like [Tripterygium wilfordii]|uniref:F-box protein At2g27310-like n=1 Tax=Tripterygium wilfordii TaxID=458696 RepID=UPI0018F846BC|nr:F-box protein At2g27310-like [Tripterygium wilfordii]